MPPYPRSKSEPLIWTVPSLYSPAECTALIARAEAHGYEQAPINDHGTVAVRRHARDNERAVLLDTTLSAQLWTRIAAHVPPRLSGMRPVGANELLRFYRYTAGQHFAMHCDASFERDSQERSLLTVLLYLNEDFDGGETYFRATDSVIAPRTGAVLLFEHSQEHEGCTVRTGVKHVMRSDVMYRRGGVRG